MLPPIQRSSIPPAVPSPSTQWASLAALAIALLCSCDSASGEPEPAALILSDTIWSAANAVDSARPWIGRVSDLLYVSDSGTLLVRDGARNAASEISSSGVILHTYHPRIGQGPGELRSLNGVVATPDEVLLLDNRNRRLLRYGIRGEFLGDVQLKRNCASLAALDDELFCVPGSDGAAFDVYSFDGVYVGGRGASNDLPTPSCPDHTCDQMPPCSFCSIAATPSHTLIVAEATTPSLVEFEATGAVSRTIQLDRFAFVREWKAQAFDDIRSRADERPPNAIETKSFIAALAPLSTGDIALAVLPPRAVLQSAGRELWLVQPDSGTVRRYQYGTSDLGQRVAISDDSTLYVADADGSVIVSFQFPPHQ